MQATETTLQKILTGTRVFELPFFQRRYRWGGPNWEELWEDLVEQYDHPDVVAGRMPSNQGHFLGSVVLHPSGAMSTVAKYLLVDGQQRITTFLALIAAFRDYRLSQDRSWNPAAYDDLYLLNPYNLDNKYRLVPTVRDRESYRLTLHEGTPTGQIGRAYKFFLNHIRRLARRDGSLDFPRFENTVLLRMLVVEITTSPTDDVNHIFQTLNDSGEQLAPLDLVRNHTFMQLPNADSERFYSIWLGLEEMLGESRMERYFWAQFVRTNPKATQRNLYSAYQQRLKTLAEIEQVDIGSAAELELTRLAGEAELFDSVEDPVTAESRGTLPTPIAQALRELQAWGSQVHLPLSLEILSRWKNQQASEAETILALRYTLSYLVRRALCAIPTNNLNRIFASLPVSIDMDRSLDVQVGELLATEQRYWPTDRQVLEQVQTVPLQLGSRGDQVRFILSRIENALSGESRSAEALLAQPILPSRLTPAWREYLAAHDPEGPDEALTRTHTLGNLALVPVGTKLGTAPFPEQRELVAELPRLRVNESIVEAHEWTTASIGKRATELARIAIQIWPRVTGVENRSIEDGTNSLYEVLLEIPENDWTTVESLSELFAVRVDTMISEVNDLEPVVAAKVLGRDGQLPEWLPPSRRDALIEQLEAAGYAPGGVIYEAPTPLTAVQLRELAERREHDGERS